MYTPATSLVALDLQIGNGPPVHVMMSVDKQYTDVTEVTLQQLTLTLNASTTVFGKTNKLAAVKVVVQKLPIENSVRTTLSCSNYQCCLH